MLKISSRNSTQLQQKEEQERNDNFKQKDKFNCHTKLLKNKTIFAVVVVFFF